MQGDRRAVRRGPQGRLQACRQGVQRLRMGSDAMPEYGNAVAPRRRAVVDEAL